MSQLDVQNLIHELKPSSVLILHANNNPANAQAFEDDASLVIDRYNVTDNLSTLSLNNRYSLAIVNDCLDQISTDEGTFLLAKLRDLYCKHLVVLQTNSSEDWQATAFYALGLKHLTVDSGSDQSLQLYEYNIHNYKWNPQWLNNRFWANPDRWTP